MLVKPQFEASREEVGSGGVVRSESVRESVLARVNAGMEEEGFSRGAATPSPFGDGWRSNIETFVHYRLRSDGGGKHAYAT